MNILQRKMVELLLPMLLSSLLKLITVENVRTFKKNLFDAGDKLTDQIPGQLDDLIWDRVAGAILLEGVFKDKEGQLVEWIEQYIKELGNVPMAQVLIPLVAKLKDIIREEQESTTIVNNDFRGL